MKKIGIFVFAFFFVGSVIFSSQCMNLNGLSIDVKNLNDLNSERSWCEDDDCKMSRTPTDDSDDENKFRGPQKILVGDRMLEVGGATAKKASRYCSEDYWDIEIGTVGRSEQRLGVGVFDGHGHAHARVTQDEVSKMAAESLINTIFMADKLSDEAIIESFASIDIATSNQPYLYQGSTASVVFFSKDEVIVAHVGDSRVVVCGVDGKVIYQTPDHTLSNACECSRIESCNSSEIIPIFPVKGTLRLSGELVVTRALGDYRNNDEKGGVHKLPGLSYIPEIKRLNLLECGFVVLATDGLWNMVPQRNALCGINDEIAAFVNDRLNGGEGVQDIAYALMSAYANGRDDITIFVIRINGCHADVIE